MRINKGRGLQTTREANVKKTRDEGDGEEHQPPVKIKKMKRNNDNKSVPTSSEDCSSSKYFDGLVDSEDNNARLTESGDNTNESALEVSNFPNSDDSDVNWEP